jgi:glycosyltransferase involved in cell wall biosynthesis
MRILVLTKRQYMGMDLLDDRFGRFRELPLELARLGHAVMGVAFSYRTKEQHTITDGDLSETSNVLWHSINLRSGLIPHIGRYAARVKSIAEEFRPDLIWACSDAYHAIFGSWLASRLGVCCVIDLYDNFESYKATWVPGVLPRFKGAVRTADGVTCVSHLLAGHIARNYRRDGPIFVLQNSARTDIFFPRERSACRKGLSLPEEAPIIGTAGALNSSRSIHTLFGAFDLLRKKRPMLRLALAGSRSRSTQIPSEPGVFDFGTVPLDKVPILFNALDVGVICNRDSAFGRYCFPQKAHEIIACRVPVVAAAVGSMKELLTDYPQCLYEPENQQGLAQAIEQQLESRTILNIPVPSWADSAKKLEAFFLAVLKFRSLSNYASPAGFLPN